MRRLLRCIPLIALVVLVAGCQSSLPVYELMPAPDAQRLIAGRFQSIDAIHVAGSLTLVASDGQRVSADFATVHDRSQMKMRIWKMGTAVYDLTLTNEGVWIYDAMKDRESALSLSADDLHRAWQLFMGSLFLAQSAQENALDTETISLVWRQPGETIECQFDRRQLLPRRYVITRSQGEQLTMGLARYRMTEDMPWPTRMTLSGPAGQIRIRLTDLSFTSIDAAIFKPSRRAERIR